MYNLFFCEGGRGIIKVDHLTFMCTIFDYLVNENNVYIFQLRCQRNILKNQLILNILFS